MLRRDLLLLTAVLVAPAAPYAAAQAPRPGLVPRQVPCQAQYARAVETIGLARWSAPEAERPSIERLLNAAAKAKELVDASFLKWQAQLCSSETLTELRASVQTIESNGWLPATPEDRRQAEAAAANAELLKAISDGMTASRATASSHAAAPPSSQQAWTGAGANRVAN